MIDKFYTAVKTLKPNTEMTWNGEIQTEDDFNKVQWKTGEDNNGVMQTGVREIPVTPPSGSTSSNAYKRN